MSRYDVGHFWGQTIERWVTLCYVLFSSGKRPAWVNLHWPCWLTKGVGNGKVTGWKEPASLNHYMGEIYLRPKQPQEINFHQVTVLYSSVHFLQLFYPSKYHHDVIKLSYIISLVRIKIMKINLAQIWIIMEGLGQEQVR